MSESERDGEWIVFQVPLDDYHQARVFRERVTAEWLRQHGED